MSCRKIFLAILFCLICLPLAYPLAPPSNFREHPPDDQGLIDESEAMLREVIVQGLGTNVEQTVFVRLKTAIENGSLHLAPFRAEVRDGSVLVTLPGNNHVFVLEEDGNVTRLLIVKNLRQIRMDLSEVLYGEAILRKLFRNSSGDLYQNHFAASLANLYAGFFKHGKKEYLHSLQALMRHRRLEVREEAAKVMAKLYADLFREGQRNYLSELEKMKRSRSGYMRRIALQQLPQIYGLLVRQGETEYLDALSALMVNPDVDEVLQASVAEILTGLYVDFIKQGREGFLFNLERMRRDERPSIRMPAAKALAVFYCDGIRHGADYVMAIKNLMNSQLQDVQQAVAKPYLDLDRDFASQGRSNELSDLKFFSQYWRWPGTAAGREPSILERQEEYARECARLVKEGKAHYLPELKSLREKLEKLLGGRSWTTSGWGDDNTLIAKIAIFYAELARSGEEQYVEDLQEMMRDGWVRWQTIRRIAPIEANLYVDLIIAGENKYLHDLMALLDDFRARDVVTPAFVKIYNWKLGAVLPRYVPLAGNEASQDLFQDYLMMYALSVGISRSQMLLGYDQMRSQFRKVNDALSEDRRLDEKSFFNDHAYSVSFLLEVMGDDAFSLLKGLLKSDPYPLRRFFQTLDSAYLPIEISGPLAAFYRQAQKKDLSSFQKIVEILPAYVGLGKTDVFQRMLQESQDKPWAAVYKDLATKYLQSLVEKLEIPSAEIDPDVFARFPLKYLPRLSVSMDFIKWKFPHRVAFYRSLLKAMLEGRFSRFLTDETQPDEEGAKLALHNAKVRAEIKKSGIDERAWTNYSKEQPFSFFARNLRIDPEDEIARLMGLLAGLKNKLVGPVGKHKAPLDNVLGKHQIAIQENAEEKFPALWVDRSGDLRADRGKILQAFKQKSFLESLRRTLTHIQGQTSQEAVDVKEVLGHALETLERLTVMIQDPDVLREMAQRKKNFRIKLWRREPAHDLFLGDLTGCCLATNSDQHFEAMIDHLIDQGIQVAEVIDEDTGDTMALAWMFLALDEKGKPHLVIDNIEIADDYAAVSPLKEKVKKQLIEFATEYGAEIKAKSLVAGLFTHSKMNLNEYPKKPRKLLKLGGYFNDERYYLEALGTSHVHVLAGNLASKRVKSAADKVTKTKEMLDKAA